jgi:hypothetical protein
MNDNVKRRTILTDGFAGDQIHIDISLKHHARLIWLARGWGTCPGSAHEILEFDYACRYGPMFWYKILASICLLSAICFCTECENTCDSRCVSFHKSDKSHTNDYAIQIDLIEAFENTF